MFLPVNIPKEIAEQNMARFNKKLQDYFAELCNGPKDLKLLKTHRKIGDNNQKILFVECEFCSSGVVIIGYKVEDNDVTLFSVWPMKKEDKPGELFSDHKAW